MVSDSPGNAVQAVMLMPPNYDVNDMKGDPNKLGAVPQGVTTVDDKSREKSSRIQLTSGIRILGGQLTSSLIAVLPDRFITSGN